jgi:hypothetical protein
MSHPRDFDAKRHPRQRLWFGGGVVLIILGLAGFALSAFMHSVAVNVLTGIVLPGVLMAVYGWRGSLR